MDNNVTQKTEEKKTNYLGWILGGFLAIAAVVIIILLLLPKSNQNTAQNNEQNKSFSTGGNGQNTGETAPSVDTYRETTVEASNTIFKRKGRYYWTPTAVQKIDFFTDSVAVRFACRSNNWLASQKEIDKAIANGTLDKYTFKKDEIGYYLDFIPNEVGNAIQFGDKNSRDPMIFNHWCRLDRLGSAKWFYNDPVSGDVGADPKLVDEM